MANSNGTLSSILAPEILGALSGMFGVDLSDECALPCSEPARPSFYDEHRVAVMQMGHESGLHIVLSSRVHGAWPDGTQVRLSERIDGGCGYTVESDSFLDSLQAILRIAQTVPSDPYSDQFIAAHTAFAERLQSYLESVGC